jgi:hypothetical protein
VTGPDARCDRSRKEGYRFFFESAGGAASFFLVPDDPIGKADLEQGALDATHCQRNRAKRHDRSPKKIRGRLARRCESDGTPGYTRRDHISRHSRAFELLKTVALPFDVSVSAIKWSGHGWCAPGMMEFL